MQVVVMKRYKKYVYIKENGHNWVILTCFRLKMATSCTINYHKFCCYNHENSIQLKLIKYIYVVINTSVYDLRLIFFSDN